MLWSMCPYLAWVLMLGKSIIPRKTRKNYMEEKTGTPPCLARASAIPIADWMTCLIYELAHNCTTLLPQYTNLGTYLLGWWMSIRFSYSLTQFNKGKEFLFLFLLIF